jgi:hypothetical protein
MFDDYTLSPVAELLQLAGVTPQASSNEKSATSRVRNPSTNTAWWHAVEG